ncbi:MAG: hypothetical protein ACHQU1_12795, partial [Gemmatimonadales bacterium]
MRARHLLPAVLSLVLACGHGEVFTTPATGTDQPFQPGTPTRLTYNPLLDSEVAWSADGSALIYTATRADEPNLSRCVEMLPPGGGRSTRSICPAPLIFDSTVALESAALSDSGRLAYLRSAKGPLNSGWINRVLVSVSPDGMIRAVAATPFADPVQPYGGLSQLRWLDENRLVYLAEDYHVVFCLGCVPYDQATPRVIVAVDLTTDPATFTIVPGTTGATGVSVVGPDSILYTLGGDAHVYRQVLSTGAVASVWDFGAGTVRWAQRAGNRLTALVNGAAWLVDLGASTATQV